jgi:3-hydroxyisobutyrate dehydrogenase
MSNSKLGWIGLGNMGIPMSKQLIKAGFDLTVYNRNPLKTEELVKLGSKTAANPSQLIDGAEIVLIMVSDDQAVVDIFTGDKGLLKSTATHKTIVNMSTISPSISREMASLCKKNGHNYLDAPVSGSVKQAEEGQLVIMVGGDEATYQKVATVFSHLGKISSLVGETGAGNIAKLAINTLLGIQAQGLAEAVNFAENNGIQKTDLLNLINNSALGSVFIKIKGEAIISQNFNAVFALKHIAKDLRLAKAEGINSPLADTVLQSFQEAEATHGDQDIIAIANYLS